MSTTARVVDVFAGPGGWDEGMADIGIRAIGVELDADACRTRVAAGHRTVRADAAVYPPDAFRGFDGLVVSPPCQAFSTAGKREGAKDVPALHAAVESCRDGWVTPDATWHDHRSPLVLEPLRWACAIRPTWIACEQVPPVLPLWEHMADVLRSWGYDALAIRLVAADYGVPQTRRRAFLLAHRDGARVAEPTHAQRPEPGLFAGRKPWVTMAEALGWGPGGRVLDRRFGGNAADLEPVGDDRPAPTLTMTKGREVWRVRTSYGEPHRGKDAGSPKPEFDPMAFPCRTVNTKTGDWIRERPATSVAMDEAVRITVPEASVLQGFRPDYPWQGSQTSRFRQIGNAVPPTWAAHIIGALSGQARRKAA